MKSPIATRELTEKDWLKVIPRPLHAWLVPIAIVALWQAAGGFGWISATLLPTPLTIAKQFANLGASGELWEHFRISILRALSGFLLGGLTGLALGVSTGLGKMAERTLDPSLQMLRTVPLLSLIPLFILWFGIGEFSKILMISLGAFFPMYVNTFLGIRNVDAKLYEVSRIFQYSKPQLLIRLIVPAALPNILLGIRLARRLLACSGRRGDDGDQRGHWLYDSRRQSLFADGYRVCRHYYFRDHGQTVRFRGASAGIQAAELEGYL